MNLVSENNLEYNNSNKSFARYLRNNSTKGEIRLWVNVLKARKLMGYKFSRQRPVLDYVADFMCRELKLIIEIDGISHSDDKVYEKDKIRDKRLSEAGFYIIRFSEKDVMQNTDGVRMAIEEEIKKINIQK